MSSKNRITLWWNSKFTSYFIINKIVFFNLNPAFNVKAAASKKKQIDVQANTSILTNLVVQLELAKITLRKETPLIQLIDSPILPLEKIKTSKLQSIIIYGIISFTITAFFLIIANLYKKNIT